MADPANPRVAVYIDFDNIIISHYDFVHGRDSWRNDRIHFGVTPATKPKLAKAKVDFGAILDYASSFGPVVVTRAYADWSVPANSEYRRQLIDRAVDLTQLFPVSKTKNGADIRLSVDVVEDMFRLEDITHVVVVAGDSDYIALAQRAKRLGRFVVGIGIEGSTSTALVNACDQFAIYDDLLDDVEDEPEEEPASRRASAGGARHADPVIPAAQQSTAAAPAVDREEEAAASERLSPKAATRLLVRALRLIHDKNPDDEWVTLGEVKNQIQRMNAAFSERGAGAATFKEFVAERNSLVEFEKGADVRQPRVRLRSSTR